LELNIHQARPAEYNLLFTLFSLAKWQLLLEVSSQVTSPRKKCGWKCVPMTASAEEAVYRAAHVIPNKYVEYLVDI
jgi:hypothetical protein